MSGVSFAEYAKYVNKSRAYIHKLYKQGRLKNAVFTDAKTGRIMVNKKVADKILSGSKLDAEEYDSQFKDDKEFMSMSYDEARRMKTFYEGKMERLKHDKESGKLILVEDVKKAAYETGLIFRDKILSIPSQVAPILAEKTSPFEVKNVLTEYITRVLDELSHEISIYKIFHNTGKSS
jgi:hypothetical protein